MSGKYALIIGNTEYGDSGLAQLTAPGKDAEDFARVLRDKEIGAFDEVSVLLNQPSSTVNEAIDEFFDQKKPDDLLILYFSGHGVRDELGSLYLAVRNTNHTRLRSTSIKSDYIREVMDQSRSKRQVLILDCCNSGAFAQGTKAATGVSIGTSSAFEGGYGRIILTASDSTQFAWEGDQVIGETENSLFTHYLIRGLEGEADLDGDGRITVDELYDYAYERVRLATPKQTPSKFSSKQQGEIVLRQSTRIENIKPQPLSPELIDEIEDTRPYVREAAVQKLEKILKGRNIGQARSAREALEKIIADENTTRRVAQTAIQILASAKQNDNLSNYNRNEATASKKKMYSARTPQKHTANRVPSTVLFISFTLLFISILVVILATTFNGKLLSTTSTTTETPDSKKTFTPTSLPNIENLSEPLPISQLTTETPFIQPTQIISSPNCVNLLEPTDGSDLPSVGRVEFKWDKQPEAEAYVLVFTLPDETKLPFTTTSNYLGRYMETMPIGGDYTWEVVAVGKSNNEICRTTTSMFSKTEGTTYNENKIRCRYDAYAHGIVCSDP